MTVGMHIPAVTTMIISLIKFSIIFIYANLVLATLADVNVNEYYPNERYALLQLRDLMDSDANLHAKWTGPPCYKNQSQWFGISCYNWHVTHLVLEGIQLKGSLPDAFLQNLTYLTQVSLRNNSIFGTLPNLTNLIQLEFFFLSNNTFSGSIPEEYIQLPKLQKLELQHNVLQGSIPPFDQPSLVAFDVSYNHLSGRIPETRTLASFPRTSYDHNLDLCGEIVGISCPVLPPAPSPSNPKKRDDKKRLTVIGVVLIALAATLVPFLVVLVLVCYSRKGREKRQEKDSEKKKNWSSSTDDPEKLAELEFFDKERPVFNLDDLLTASAEVLGKGCLGTTYKVMMETGTPVAVKRLKDMNALSKKEFVQQMQLLGQMRHENLVQIISFYYSKEEKLVIHEFVPDGSLFELLHESRGIGRIPLSWSTRLSMIKDIAKGLIYLHHSLPSHKVPHANLKSSNILLIQQTNQNYLCKLSDFGFLPLLPTRKSSEKLAISRSPEFSEAKKLTYKTDVYSFGIIILEVITGKIPGEVSSGFSRGDESSYDDLADWVRMVVNNDWSTDVLDIEILSAKEGHDEMLKLTELALLCTDLAPENRPKMSQVLRKIEEIEQMSQE